jgi:acyl-CoA thioesterase I
VPSFIRIAFLRWLLFAFWLAAPAAWSQQPVILVLGDSLSAGYGLPAGRGWVDLLQQRLTQQKLDYKVVNASISGDTTLGGRNRLPAALAQHRPRIVVLELGGNDGLRGQPVAAIRDNLKAMVRASRAAGARALIVGIRIPPNYGQQYGRKFQDVFAEVARSEKVPLVPFLLEGFADKRDLFQQDNVHPTEEAQALMLDSVWKVLRPMLDGR